MDDTLGARGGLNDTVRAGYGAAREHPRVARQLLTAEYGILNSVRAVRERNMMINASTDPNQNQLLAALPHDQQQRWLPHLEHVEMPLGQVHKAALSLIVLN